MGLDRVAMFYWALMLAPYLRRFGKFTVPISSGTGITQVGHGSWR